MSWGSTTHRLGKHDGQTVKTGQLLNMSVVLWHLLALGLVAACVPRQRQSWEAHARRILIYRAPVLNSVILRWLDATAPCKSCKKGKHEHTIRHYCTTTRTFPQHLLYVVADNIMGKE